jgi:hypothetical protein
MPTCNKCGTTFLNTHVINGKVHNLQRRKFCLVCSPFEKHNTKNLGSDKSNNLKCISCQKQLSGKQRKFCSDGCKAQYGNNKYQDYGSQQKRSRRRKLKIISMMGGKCSICGYNKNFSALSFHHTNPKDKCIKLDSRSLSNHSWEAIMKELQKCVLLCQNCHNETHHPECLLEPLTHEEESSLEIKPLILNFCCDCGGILKNDYSVRCVACQNKTKEKISWPSTSYILELLKDNSYLEVGRTLGISDNAIRKRILNHPG